MKKLLMFASLLLGCTPVEPSLPVVDLGTTSADLAGGGATPSCLPAGYTLVPFATTTPTRSFNQVEPVLTAGTDYLAVLVTDAVVSRSICTKPRHRSPPTPSSF